jgi:hypothetical protein
LEILDFGSGLKSQNQEQERNFTGTWSWFLKKLHNIDGRSLDFVAGSDGGLSKLIDLRLKLSELR